MRYVERSMNRVTRRLVLLVAMVVLVACNKGSAPKLEGRWRGVKASGVPAEQVGTANLFASTMELEFKGDVVSVHTGSEKQSGKFKVVSDDKKAVVIVTDQTGPTTNRRSRSSTTTRSSGPSAPARRSNSRKSELVL